MNSKAKIALFCTAVALIAAVIFGAAYAVSRAAGEKAKYIDAEQRLALTDLCEALREMEKAADEGDLPALNFAAGRAEAYLSRAGLGDAGEIYGIIRLIASGGYGAEECHALRKAAEKLLRGDRDAFGDLRSIQKSEAESEAETTEDMLASRMLERIGKGRDDVALARATAFACPNAVFVGTVCDGDFFKYSGDNIFIAVGAANSRILMYCFEREVDPEYSISAEEAADAAENVVKREKLKLRGEAETELKNGIYRNVWYGDDGEELAVVEIYSDTGRLRLYNAVKYYENLN